jgi:hypothetical protein
VGVLLVNCPNYRVLVEPSCRSSAEEDPVNIGGTVLWPMIPVRNLAFLLSSKRCPYHEKCDWVETAKPVNSNNNRRGSLAYDPCQKIVNCPNYRVLVKPSL